jgi:hypothetical protein
MMHYLRFALLAGLAAGIPAIALDPPQHQNKQTEAKQEQKNEKKAEPAKKDSAPKENDDRLDRRNSRMKERNREIDGLLNKSKN